jgi:protein O-GlcNAc transferase
LDFGELLAQAIASRNADQCLKLAIASLQQELVEAAFEAARASLAIDSRYSDGWNVLGVLWRRIGNLEESELSHQRAVELDPTFAEAWNNLGVVFQEQGRFDDAAQAYLQALSIQPTLGDTHHNLAKVFRHLGKYSLAQHHCQQALLARPDLTDARITLGRVQMDALDFDRATQNLKEACTRAPENAEAFYYLGMAYENSRAPELASKAYRRTIELDPQYFSALDGLVHQLQHLCDWHDIDSLAVRLIECVEHQSIDNIPQDHRNVIAPFSFICLPIETSPNAQLKCARRLAKTITLATPKLPNYVPMAKPKIRIGYLSADFHAHATARLMTELIEAHDRTRFEVIGYSYGPNDQSPLRHRLEGAFDAFVDIQSAPHQESAERIRSDAVDILIDLKGYTQFGRPQILAARPAPIQIQYLGFPGTMGAEFIDYVLLDEFIAPSSHDPFYAEKIIRLPGCYQANDSRFEIADWPRQRSEVGLPDQAFVFCCFNAHYKITPAIYDIWMQLLKAKPSSVLWLLEGNPMSEKNLRSEAEKRDVDATRLIFAPRLESSKHVARHRLADLYLDTFPVTAHTAASDVLRTGLPMVSMAGKSMISRVAGSLLFSLGLPELIANSFDDYGRIASHFSDDSDQLNAMRRRIERSSVNNPLFFGQALAIKLERVFEELAKRRTGPNG